MRKHGLFAHFPFNGLRNRLVLTVVYQKYARIIFRMRKQNVEAYQAAPNEKNHFTVWRENTTKSITLAYAGVLVYVYCVKFTTNPV